MVMQATEPFVEALFEGLEGYAYVPVLDDGRWITKFFQWPEEKEALYEWVRSGAENCDCYISPSLFHAPRAIKANFKVAQYLWCDIDADPPTWLSEPGSGPLTRHDAHPPSIIVYSSGNGNKQHAYWHVQPITDYPVLEAYNRGIAMAISADHSGWDCTQVLRVPGTRNLKYANRPEVGLSADWNVVDSPLYSLDFFPFHVPKGRGADILGDGGVGSSAHPTAEITLENVLLTCKIPNSIVRYLQSEEVPSDRSNALMHTAHVCVENGFTPNQTMVLIRHLDDRWGKYANREERESYLVRIIELAYAKRQKQSGIRGFVDFNKGAGAGIKWAFENLLPDQGHLVLTGPSGVGKTLFSLNAALHFSAGIPFLSLTPVGPQRLLYLSLEMGATELAIFTKALEEGTGAKLPLDKINRNLYISASGSPVYIDKDEGKAEFEAMIDELRPTGIMIDTLGSFIANGLSSDDVIRRTADYLEDVRSRYGCYTWVVHHQRKPPENKTKSDSLADLYGSQYIAARASTVLGLFHRGDIAGNLRLSYLKSRFSGISGDLHICRTNDLQYSVGTIKSDIVGVGVGFSKDKSGKASATITTADEFTKLVGF